MTSLIQIGARTVSSLTDQDFRRYWLGNLVSFLGRSFREVTTDWLVYNLTGSAVILAWVGSARGISTLILAPFGGLLADRVDKRKLMATMRLSVAAIILAMAAIIFLGTVTALRLFLAILALSAALSLEMPARQTMMLDLVGRPRLANAIGLGYIAIHSSSILGPTLAGYSIATMGAAASLCLAATLFLIGALAAAAISAPAPTAKARPTSTLASLAEGLAYLRHDLQLFGLLGTGIAFVLLGATPFRLMPVFAQDIYQVGAVGLGLMVTAQGLGSLIGAFTVATLGDGLRKGWMLLASGLLTGATSIAFAATSSFTAGLGLLLVVGIARGTYLSLNSTLLQTISSDEMRGRVVGLYGMTWGLMPLSLIPLGAISDAFGPRLTVGGTGALLLLLMTVAASLRSQIRDLP